MLVQAYRSLPAKSLRERRSGDENALLRALTNQGTDETLNCWRSDRVARLIAFRL